MYTVKSVAAKALHTKKIPSIGVGTFNTCVKNAMEGVAGGKMKNNNNILALFIGALAVVIATYLGGILAGLVFAVFLSIYLFTQMDE